MFEKISDTKIRSTEGYDKKDLDEKKVKLLQSLNAIELVKTIVPESGYACRTAEYILERIAELDELLELFN